MAAPWSTRGSSGLPAPRSSSRSGGADGLHAAVWDLDLRTGILAWSEGMYRICGATREEVRPSLSWWTSLVVAQDRARVRASFLVVRETGRGAEEQFRMLGLDGVERCVHAWTEVEFDAEGTPVRMFGSAVDVTGLVPLGHRDPLTGLAGRAALVLRAEQAMTVRSRSGEQGLGEQGLGEQHPREQSLGDAQPAGTDRRAALVLAGLDRLGVVDDALGRGAGDAVLRSFAGRLRALAPAGATVARLDGDVFAVLVPGGDGADVAQQVLASARRAHVLPDRPEPLTVTASVGVAVGDGADRSAPVDAEDLLRQAGLALRRAKDEGRDRVVAFSASLQEAALARVRTEAVLRSALDAGRMQVLYQPVIQLGTGEIAGVEALARVVDPELGPLSPALFVGVSEETGLVVRLDEWVLGRASAMAGRWEPPTFPAPTSHASPTAQATGTTVDLRTPSLPTVAVNMSSRTLARPDLPRLVKGALSLSGAGSERLLVEITEHSLLDQGEDAQATLEGLARLGVGVGIDDFGTGWSALSYLNDLDLSFMKIDRCFVSRLGVDSSATAICKAVIDLAHAHDLSVIAEGVETEDQARRLTALGCDHGQGWWFGRPTAEADLNAVVEDWYERAEQARFGAWDGQRPGLVEMRSSERTTGPMPVLTLLG